MYGSRDASEELKWMFPIGFLHNRLHFRLMQLLQIVAFCLLPGKCFPLVYTVFSLVMAWKLRYSFCLTGFEAG